MIMRFYLRGNDMNDLPLVSVVIPTLNSEKTLQKCLKSVFDQTYANIEVNVVDAGSEDNTVKIATTSGSKVINANVKSMTQQTNLGIINSEGEYIYRVDSDVILPPSIISESIKKCEEEGYDGVCIFWIPDESISFWAKVRKIEKECYVQHPNYIGATSYTKNVLGARFLKRDVLEAVGSFDEEIPTLGEDYALYNKLAQSDYKFALIKSREKHIGEPKTLKDVFSKNFNYGVAMRFFLQNQKLKGGITQFSPMGRNYLLTAFKKSWSIDKKLFLGLIIYLSVLYSSTTLGLIFGVVNKNSQIKSGAQ